MEKQSLVCGVERRGATGTAGGRAVTISTEQPVRAGGGIARAAGAVLGPYQANPVVMWGHDYSQPPIAKCTALSVAPGVGITAEFDFPDEGIYPLADIVRGLWDAGFINAASIGFAPLKWNWSGEGEARYPVFETWELYEFSLVSIPRDREALRRAVEMLGGEEGDRKGSPLRVAASGVDLMQIYRGLKAWREGLHA